MKHMPRPTIVCLCGSTRFYKEYALAQNRETMAGRIVLTVGSTFCSDGELFADLSEIEKKSIKEMLDWLHKCKIRMSDEILVLNVDGYVGESTASEIAYAKELGKHIRYLEAIR